MLLAEANQWPEDAAAYFGHNGKGGSGDSCDMGLRTRLANTLGAMSTRAQLLSAFAAVLLLTGAVGAVGLLGLQRVDLDAEALSRKWLPGVAGQTALQLGRRIGAPS
jgi:hypothetical protein